MPCRRWNVLTVATRWWRAVCGGVTAGSVLGVSPIVCQVVCGVPVLVLRAVGPNVEQQGQERWMWTLVWVHPWMQRYC